MEIKYTRAVDVSWQNTFYPNHKYMVSMEAAWESAKTAGYPYVAWNGNVYETCRLSCSAVDVIVPTSELPK